MPHWQQQIHVKKDGPGWKRRDRLQAEADIAGSAAGAPQIGTLSPTPTIAQRRLADLPYSALHHPTLHQSSSSDVSLWTIHGTVATSI